MEEKFQDRPTTRVRCGILGNSKFLHRREFRFFGKQRQEKLIVWYSEDLFSNHFFHLVLDVARYKEETVQLVSLILDCRVDILIPYIKKCSSVEQRNLSRSGTISCSISSNSSGIAFKFSE